MEQTAFITPFLVVDGSGIIATDEIQPYLDLITSQHKTKPNFNFWLTSVLNVVSDGLSVSNSINSALDIDSAVGSQLDIIGQIVGRSRSLPFQPNDGSAPTLDDTNYQIALKAKIAANVWDGTIPSIYSIWNSLFTDLSMEIVDNQNMTMSVLVDANVNIDPVITQMLSLGYIVPKPAGVGLIVIEVSKVFENQYIGGWVTTNEVLTLTDALDVIIENNYIGAIVTTNEVMTLSQ